MLKILVLEVKLKKKIMFDQIDKKKSIKNEIKI